MKNLSVGKKILAGFGAVILMLALILTISTVTSFTRNDDLQRVNQMNDIQNESNLVLDEYSLARVEIRSVFLSIETKEEYAQAVTYLDSAIARIDTMEQDSAQLDGYMSQEIQQLRKMFTEVQIGLDNVYANNEKAISVIDTMTEHGMAMADSSTQLFNVIHGVIMDSLETDTQLGKQRVEESLPKIQGINDIVSNIRVESRKLMLSQDMSAIPVLNGMLDELEMQCAALRALISSEDSVRAVEATMSAAEGFRKAVGDVEVVLKASETQIAVTRVVFLDLFALVNQCVEIISDDVTQLNIRTIKTSQVVMVVMIVIGIIAVVFSICVAVILGRSITRPLGKMKAIMLQAGETGNMVFNEDVKHDILVESEVADEIGQSLKAFTKLIDHITYIAGCLSAVANKDLTIDVKLLSEVDTMGLSLSEMVDNLNEMFGEMNSIAKQVAASSNEVALGAQSLAQGSTEQAATVEEISASITNIDEQMNVSNQTATEAAILGNEISQEATVGNTKMEQMMGSMQAINDASKAIGRVIKVIDDIAFQTNILALNAAVEAARAGQHGKGFAVVSDEVRNLAAKSADAAKETSVLISENIEKTLQGLQYTQETAESLKKIIDGINMTNNSLQAVAEQSQGTKAATAQVTIAVDQVATVVQQNSATSEQSAASSKEMSSQAQVLQQYIARFRLKGGSGYGNFVQSFSQSSGRGEISSDDMELTPDSLNKY